MLGIGRGRAHARSNDAHGGVEGPGHGIAGHAVRAFCAGLKQDWQVIPTIRPSVTKKHQLGGALELEDEVGAKKLLCGRDARSAGAISGACGEARL